MTTSNWPDPLAATAGPEPEPPDRFREGLILALSALTAAVLVLGGLFWLTRSDGENNTETAADVPVQIDEIPDEGAELDNSDSDGELENSDSEDSDSEDSDSEDSDSQDSDSQESTAGSDVEHIDCPSDVPGEVCDAARFVEEFRGMPFKEFPAVSLIDDQAFADRLLRDFEDDREELDVSTEVWRSLGFIEPHEDLAEALASSFEVGVVGVYFTDTKELYIQGTDLDLYAELVIVHELVHAHDDQWFDLYREEYEDAEDEVGYGFSAMIEGNASRVEAAWRAQLSASDEAELARLEASVLSPKEIDIYLSLPAILLQFQISPYVDGEVLVDEIANGGEEAVNEALLNPPRTSEQVLHPELYESSEPMIVVANPPADGEIIDEGVVGELAFDLWLGDRIGDGWGGDRYVSWRTGDGTCTRVDVVGDNDRETQEFATAAQNWASGNGDRTVEVLADQMVRITSCY